MNDDLPIDHCLAWGCAIGERHGRRVCATCSIDHGPARRTEVLHVPCGLPVSLCDCAARVAANPGLGEQSGGGSDG